MANLDRIEQRLKNDGQYRASFLRDPVAALAQEGLQMSHAAQMSVREAVERIRRKPRKLPGSIGSHGAEKISLPLIWPFDYSE